MVTTALKTEYIRLVDKWKKILMLDDWDIDVKFKKMSEVDEAQINWWNDENKAIVYINKDKPSERILLHELIHILCRHTVDIKDFMEEEADIKLIDCGVEWTVKGLTNIFMKLYGENTIRKSTK